MAQNDFILLANNEELRKKYNLPDGMGQHGNV